MTQVGLCSTAYWLRHTYAQNLLEAGASIYEVKLPPPEVVACFIGPERHPGAVAVI
jgi:hypothetical protein